jgi:biopolymer transport protein TolR
LSVRARVQRPEIITKVNVTPIIDVALVLVIILLVTAPMMSVSDLPVNLPQARTREAEDQRNVCITISEKGEFAVDDHTVAAGGLEPALALALARPGNRDVLVVVRADRQVPFSTIRHTLAQARDAGARRLAIATRQRAEARP